MDKLFSVTQLVLSCIMLLCVVISVVAHIIMGNINSFLGYIVSLIFLYLMWNLVRISLKEYIEEKNK